MRNFNLSLFFLFFCVPKKIMSASETTFVDVCNGFLRVVLTTHQQQEDQIRQLITDKELIQRKFDEKEKQLNDLHTSFSSAFNLQPEKKKIDRTKHNLFVNAHRTVFRGRNKDFKVRNLTKEYQRIRNKLKVQNERELLIRNDRNQWIPYVPTSSSSTA